MIEIENFESSLKETENENFAFDESDVRTILKLYAPEFLDDQFGKILFHQQFEELEKEIRTLIDLERFTLLIEIECKHWISLHVETSKSRSNCACQKIFPSAETNDADLFAYYYDPQNIDFDLKIKSVLLKLGKVNFSRKEEDQSFVVTQSFLKSLLFSLDYKNEKLDDFSAPHKQPLGFQEFYNELTSMLNESKKVKDKIKACSGIFSLAVEDSIRAIPDYKCANRLVFFLECLALEDRGLTNEKLKEYLIKEVIGEKNTTIIKELRGMIFHRKESLVFYPQDFKKAFLKPTKDVFQSLSSYLKCVESALEGKETDRTFLLEGTKHLSVPCEFGINICEEEVKTLLGEFAEDYLKNYPENLTKHPDKIMFDLTVNFVPLLELQYKKSIRPFDGIIKFRNQLVHNGFILYHACPNLPNISLQNLFPEFNDFFLKFVLCDNFSSILKKFSESGKSGDLETNLESCFGTFLDQFPISNDPLKDDLHMLDLIGDEPSKNNQFTQIAETYLSTISWIDSKNNISIDKDIKTQHFSLPDDYSLFSDSQRKDILRSMILIKQMHHSLKSSNSKNTGKCFTQACFDVWVESKKNGLTSSCLEESDFRLMYDSLINSGEEQSNKELASIIAGHISDIKKKLMWKDMSNASKITEDFILFANKPGKTIPMTKNISMFMSMNGLEDIYDIIISHEIVSVSVKKIIQNMLPVLFISPGKALTWTSSIEDALNDDVFLELLSNETMEKEKLVGHLADIPALVPLRVRWLLDKKLKFSEQENLQFMKSCIKPLLQPNRTRHLGTLLTFKAKYIDEFCDECLKLVIAKLPHLNFIALKPLFENEKFASNVLKKLREVGMFEKEKVNQEVKLLISFANFKYFKAVELYRQKQYESALECTSGKKGYSKVLQTLTERGHVSHDSENTFQMKFLIANINNKIGFTRLNNPDSDSKKHIDDSMKLLSHLQERNKKKNLFRSLKINNLIAFNYHLQGNFESSFNMYVAIMNTLLALNYRRPPRSMLFKEGESSFSSDSLKKLLKSKSYRRLLRKFGRNLSVLNIIYRKGWELTHMAVIASNKTEEKNLLLRAFEQYSYLTLLNIDTFNRNIFVKSLIQSLLIANKLFVEFETKTISLKNLKAYKILTDDGKIHKGLWDIKFMIESLESKMETADQNSESNINVETKLYVYQQS